MTIKMVEIDFRTRRRWRLTLGIGHKVEAENKMLQQKRKLHKKESN